MNLSLLLNTEDGMVRVPSVWKSIANGAVEGLACICESQIVGVTFVDATDHLLE